jgi:phage terminase large subunit-like protein
MLEGVGEAGAEVYSAAASRDQATIVYQEALNMAKSSASLTARLTLQPAIKRMFDAKTNSWYRALSADAGTNEGLNIHALIMDEMHAQPDDKFWNTLMYGGAARRQPLIVVITTAGVDQDSICYEYHTKAMQIQEGLVR